LIERLSALSGLLAENFTLGPSRHFLDMGRRLERAVALCQTARAGRADRYARSAGRAARSF
jgi:uncharacterized alpha-E superfamily protein